MADDPLPQTSTGKYLLPLQLALYDTTATTTVRGMEDAALVAQVTTALQTAVFCPLHILLVNDFNQNVCPDDDSAASDSVVLNNDTSASSSSSASSTPSILDASPYAIAVSPVSSDGFLWSVWTLQYTLLQVGDVYIAEALQNAVGTDIATLAPAAAQSMRAVLQLTLDVNAMDGTLDEVLRRQQPNATQQIYLRPVEEALRQWQGLGPSSNVSYATWQPRTWYPLRIAGMVLWVLTVGAAWLLPHLASRRKRRRQVAVR